MEYLKEINGIKIWADYNLTPNLFKTGKSLPELIAPGYWTTPTDSTKRSINPLEDAELPGINRRLSFPEIKCIIVPSAIDEDIDRIIRYLSVQWSA